MMAYLKALEINIITNANKCLAVNADDLHKNKGGCGIVVCLALHMY